MAREHAAIAYNNRPTCFATPGKSLDKIEIAETNEGFITVPITGKRKGDMEELLKKGPGRPAGSKNNPAMCRERAASMNIQDMLVARQTITQQDPEQVY
jgi:hypothetical protein